MSKRKDVRELLRPHLERLGAVCIRRDLGPDTLGCEYEDWEIMTGAGRLEISPQDSWAAPGKRKRRGGHIHSRFDNGDLAGTFTGDSEHECHTGKWNFYAFDTEQKSVQFLVDYFVTQLERAIAWVPRPEDHATALRWADASGVKRRIK